MLSLSTSSNPLLGEWVLVTREQSNNKPNYNLSLEHLNSRVPFNQLPIKLGNYSLIVNVNFIAYKKELKKDIVNKNQNSQLKIKVILVLNNPKNLPMVKVNKEKDMDE